MKLIILYLLLITCIPSILVAQYIGGSGDGDNNSTLFGSTLYGTDLLYVYYGGIGDGSASGGSVDVPLPVNLSYFTFTINNNRDVLLKWGTASEFNNIGFDILRSFQNDDKNWMKIGYVQGNGTCNFPNEYTYEDLKLTKGKYVYRLKQIDNNGNYEFHNLNVFVEIALPKKYELSQNYPNPFNPTTKIDFDLPFNGKVTIKVYDITGRELAFPLNEVKVAGYYTLLFDAGNLASGIYFYKIIAGEYSAIKKMMLIK